MHNFPAKAMAFYCEWKPKRSEYKVLRRSDIGACMELDAPVVSWHPVEQVAILFNGLHRGEEE